MNTLHRERRRRTLRWAIFSPVASVLLVGSAWAQSSGKWPVIWQAVTSVFVAEPPPSAPSSPSSSRRSAPYESGPRPALAPPSAGLADAGADVGRETALPSTPDPEPADRAGARGEPVPPGPEPVRPRRPRRAQPRPVEPPREAAPLPEPERERELSRFRRAHDLHFKGRADDAIEAYADYLREFPGGRFVPEARYAMALDQIKLGHDAAAREALAPFAAGHYGGYRQKEARQLLDALEQKKPATR